MNKAILFMGLVFTAACAHKPTVQERNNTWVGHTESQVVSQLGPPASTFTDTEDNLYYVYESRGPVVTKAGNYFHRNEATSEQAVCKSIYKFNPLFKTVLQVRNEGQCK